MAVFKIYIWRCFWSCSLLKTLSAGCKSPSNAKQRQGTFQVSRGAASPSAPLILTGKIAEWALLTFSFHSVLLLALPPFPQKLPKHPNLHLVQKSNTLVNQPWPSASLSHYSAFAKIAHYALENKGTEWCGERGSNLWYNLRDIGRHLLFYDASL